MTVVNNIAKNAAKQPHNHNIKPHMKILQLGKFHPVLGGVEKVMYDITMGLSEKGVECDMMCATSDGRGSETVELNPNGRILCCKTWVKMARTTIAPSMITKLRHRAKEYNLIHIHHPDPMAAVALMLSGFKGKVVLHWHSDILSQKFMLKFYLPIQRWLIKRADAIVGTSPVYLAESPYLQKVQGKTHCIPIGIEPNRSDNAKVERIRNEYPGRRIVFSLGRLVGYKGYGYLIDAARYLDESYMILIGGGGSLRENLQNQIDEFGLGSRVKLLGRVSDEDLPSYYGACDVYCMSSILKTEAFGIVQIEAMSEGRPLVATKIPASGVAWVNEDGVSGINVEPCDSKAIAEAIKSTWQRYSDGSRQRFAKCFTKEKMLAGCLALYSELLNDNR